MYGGQGGVKGGFVNVPGSMGLGVWGVRVLGLGWVCRCTLGVYRGKGGIRSVGG